MPPIPPDWTTAPITLGFRGRVRCSPGWKLDERWSNNLHDYNFWYVWAGRGTMQTLDGPVPLEPGVCILMRPGRLYTATQDPARRLGVTYIHFSLLSPRGKPRYDWPLPPTVTRFSDIHYVDALARRIVESTWQPTLRRTPADHTVVTHLFRGLLLDLASRHTRPLAASPSATPTDETRTLSELASKISEDPASAPSVAQMAADIGWTPDHFTRVFKSAIGRAPLDFIVTARIEHAKLLLRESNMSIKQIARAVDHSHLAYFSRHFKLHTQTPPSAWRNA